MNRKRPSGSYFRRQKMKKIEDDKKMRESLTNFLKITGPPLSKITPQPDTEDVYNDKEMEMTSKKDDDENLSTETNLISDESNKIVSIFNCILLYIYTVVHILRTETNLYIKYNFYAILFFLFDRNCTIIFFKLEIDV